MITAKRRRREKEQRRQHFIDVAQGLFLSRGVDETSIEEIARAAEFSKRTVYLYFEDKRELFLAVVLRGLSRLNEMLNHAAAGTNSGLSQVRALADAYYRFFQEERAFFDLLMVYEMREYHYAKTTDHMGETEGACQAMNDANSRLAQVAVQRLIAEGADTRGLDAVQATLVLWGQVIGILQLVARRETILETAYGLSPRAFFDRSLAASLRGVFSLPGADDSQEFHS